MKAKNRFLQGALNQSQGMLAEYQLAFELRNRSQFKWGVYFEGLKEGELPFEVQDITRRFFVQAGEHPKRELDLRIVGNLSVEGHSEARTILIEVKKWKTPVDLKTVQEFVDKAKFYQEVYPDETLILAFLALGGLTTDALDYCQTHSIGTASQIHYHQTEWSE